MKNPSLINLLFLFLLFGCESISPKSKEQTQAEKDSFSLKTYGRTYDAQIRYMTDSMMHQAEYNSMFDTVGLYKSPVKVIESTITNREYSNYRNIYLQYKNVSNKTVNAIKFRWYGKDAFGDPADMGTSLAKGFGNGFSEDIINPGAANGGEWEILSRNAKTVVLAWAYEVQFSDGSKWILNK